MRPEGRSSGNFMASIYDIDDGITDIGLKAEDNCWALLAVNIKKFDCPFVNCQLTDQASYEIK